MFRLHIKSLIHGNAWLDFPTMRELEAKLLELRSSLHWGVEAYDQVIEAQDAVLDEEGNVIQEAVEAQVIHHEGSVEYEIEDLTNKVNQEKINKEALQFLNDSDWKILRHKDQLDLGVETSLTAEEFTALIQERQNARLRIVK